jgi:hypothetical protein
MADISITPTNVVPATDAFVETVLLGETVTAGEILVYDATDDDWVVASNATDVLSGTGNGQNLRMALSSANSGQTIAVARANSDVALGAVLTAGRWYVLSVGGAISPESDAGSGDFSVLIGYAKTTSLLRFTPVSTGVQV